MINITEPKLLIQNISDHQPQIKRLHFSYTKLLFSYFIIMIIPISHYKPNLYL